MTRRSRRPLATLAKLARHVQEGGLPRGHAMPKVPEGEAVQSYLERVSLSATMADQIRLTQILGILGTDLEGIKTLRKKESE